MSVEPVDLHFKEYGEGPPLLILHGLLGSGANWHTLSRRVFAQKFTVYAIDLRNHGRSPHSDRLDYPSMVADLEVFVGRQRIAASRLLGHSMGGKVAMNFALENPT
ncbi:MAG: alpha/beta fold hydrolase, partial [Rhodothermales bacterium]